MEMVGRLSLYRDRIIVVSTIIGALSFSALYILDLCFNIPSVNLKAMYAIGTPLGFGGVLFGISMDLKKLCDYYILSVSVFFLLTGVTFGIDFMLDMFIRTKYLILLNIILSLLWLVYSLFRKLFTP